MGKSRSYSKARRANGIVSAAVVCMFLVHASLGSLRSFVHVPAFASGAVWAGVVLAGVHVLLCVATSVEQLTDTVRPPSVHKKRHLVWKWATGAGLAIVAAVHIWRVRSLGPALALFSPAGAAWTVALSVLLACHIWTGSKSLLKDLGIDRRYRTVVRVGACAFAVFFSLVAVASSMHLA